MVLQMLKKDKQRINDNGVKERKMEIEMEFERER